MRSSGIGTRPAERISAVAGGLLSLMVVLSCIGTIQAQNIYRLTATTTEGLDLTAMSGYYADRMEGPISASVNFAGPLTVDPSISESNPFRLIGNGKMISVTAANSGFHTLPLMMYNAEGITATSTLRFNAGATYSGDFLDVGKYNRFQYNYIGYGSGILSSHTVNIHDGGELVGFGLMFGRNKNLHMSVTNGAMVKADYYIHVGNQSTVLATPLTAFLGISNSTVNAGSQQSGTGGTGFCLVYGARTNDKTTENCRVVLGPNSLLQATWVIHHGGGRSAIVFDGGRYKSTGSGNIFHAYGYYNDGSEHWPWVRMDVMGVNGNPIDVETVTNRTLGGSSVSGSEVNITGTGGFTKRGEGALVFTRAYSSVCDYTGPTTILGGGIVVTNSVFKPGRGELSVAANAFLDLNGFDVEFADAVGDGVISNGAERASTLSLGWGDADASFNLAVAEEADVSLRKIGAGTLTIGQKAAGLSGNLTVTGGIVRLAAGVAMTNLANVTIFPGATLDIRGRTVACRNLLRMGKGSLLTDENTVLTVDTDADANYGGFNLPGTFSKEGAGTLTVHVDGRTNCNVSVTGGTLVVHPLLAYGGKYFKVNVFQTAESAPEGGGTRWRKPIGEFSLYDADGNRVNEHAYAYNERPGAGQYNGYGGVANASSLAEWEVALHTSGYYSYGSGCGPDKALDGDPATYYDNNSWWGSEAFMFRMGDSVADVVGFTFTTYAAGTEGQSRPVQWKIYGSENGSSWTLLADNSIDWNDDVARAALLASTPASGATEYNNGVPYTFDAWSVESDIMPLGSNGVATVSGGGTLEFSSSSMRLSALTVDCLKAGGAIRNFTPAANGILRIENLPATGQRGQYELPVAVENVTNPNMFRTWRVFVGNQPVEYLYVVARNGHLFLCVQGMYIIIK